MHKVKGRVCCLLIAIIFLVVTTGCGSKPVANIEKERAIPVVVGLPLEEDLVVFQSFPGSVEAVDEVSLTAKLGGVVEKVLVQEGDRVKKGDPIIILEQKDAQQQLAQAQAGLAAAQAQLKNLEEGQLPQQIAQLESGLKQAKANYENARDNYERMKELFDEGAIPLQQFEGVELQYQVAQEQYESAKTQLSLLEGSTAPESIAATRAQVEQAKAMVALAKSGVDSTTISAPTSGIVGAIGVKEGELASPGMPVATVGNLENVEISIHITEERINGIQVGQLAEVMVDAAREDTLEGIVHSVSPFKDPRTMLYSVKVLVPNDEGLLKSGMFARVKLATAKYPDVVTVPEDAVIFRNGDNLVFLLEGDRAKAQEVEIGASSMGRTIVKGLGPQAQVVIEGQEMLQDGVLVLVEERGSSK